MTKQHGCGTSPLIENSVAFTPRGRSAPKRLFVSVLRDLTTALVPYRADPGGQANAQKMKNPLSPFWDRAIFATTPYTLADLRQALPTRGATDKVDYPAPRAWLPDHPDATVAVQSNKLFRELAVWARQGVTPYRDAGLRDEFRRAVEDEACRLCRGLLSDSRAAEQAVQRTAQSVSSWTWERYHPRSASAPLAEIEVRSRQAAAGKTTAAGRRSATEASILAAAAALTKDSSALPTQAALAAATGRPERTIRRYWPLLARLTSNTAAEASHPSAPAIRSPCR
jgi:hypothetical protein